MGYLSIGFYSFFQVATLDGSRGSRFFTVCLKLLLFLLFFLGIFLSISGTRYLSFDIYFLYVVYLFVIQKKLYDVIFAISFLNYNYFNKLFCFPYFSNNLKLNICIQSSVFFNFILKPNKAKSINFWFVLI
jgi:hypothetical protein